MFNFYSDRRDAEMHIRRTRKPGNPRRFASWFQQLGRSLGSPSVNFSDEDYHKVTHTIRPRLSFEKRTPKLELWFCTGYCVYCWGQRARIEKPWIPWNLLISSQRLTDNSRNWRYDRDIMFKTAQKISDITNSIIWILYWTPAAGQLLQHVQRCLFIPASELLQIW